MDVTDTIEKNIDAAIDEQDGEMKRRAAGLPSVGMQPNIKKLMQLVPRAYRGAGMKRSQAQKDALALPMKKFFVEE